MVAKTRKTKKPVTTDMIRAAVIALGERNGSTVKSIFSYLVKTKKVRPSSRARVVLAIKRALKLRVLAKKLPNTVVLAPGQVSKKSAAKGRKTRRIKKKSAKKTKRSRRRRSQKKRKALKKKSRKAMKKRRRVARKSVKKPKRKVMRKNPKTAAVTMAIRKRYNNRPQRKCARGVRYTKFF